MSNKMTVPVGATPERKYGSWAEHRTALRLESETTRRKRRAMRRRVEPRAR